MKKEKEIEVLSAGTDSSHHPWMNFSRDIFNYDEYIDIITMLVDNMHDDLRKIDKVKFEADMQDIARIITKKPKHPRPVLTPEDIAIPELRLKEIQTNSRVTVKIELSQLRKVCIFNDHVILITNTRFLSVIFRDYYQNYSRIFSPAQLNALMAKDGIEFILFAYAKSIASIEKIILYAQDKDMLEDNRAVQDETPKGIDHLFSENGQNIQHKNNILRFRPDRSK